MGNIGGSVGVWERRGVLGRCGKHRWVLLCEEIRCVWYCREHRCVHRCTATWVYCRCVGEHRSVRYSVSEDRNVRKVWMSKSMLVCWKVYGSMGVLGGVSRYGCAGKVWERLQV